MTVHAITTTRDPLPSDLDAEAGVLARALEGDVSPFDTLRGDQFFSAGHAVVFAACDAARELDGYVSVAMIERLLRADRIHYLHAIDVREYLDDLLTKYEWGSSSERYVARVLAAWRARETGYALIAAEAEVRSGIEPGSAIATLGKRLRVLKGARRSAA